MRVSPCLWSICTLGRGRRDNCDVLAASGTSSQYYFLGGSGQRPARLPPMVPLSPLRVTGSEITRLHHMFTQFKTIYTEYTVRWFANASVILSVSVLRVNSPVSYKRS
jgi:hypothetical protein